MAHFSVEKYTSSNGQSTTCVQLLPPNTLLKCKIQEEKEELGAQNDFMRGKTDVPKYLIE